MEENSDTMVGKNGSDDVGNWFFSLIPVGVAYLFYVVLVLQADLENTNLYIAFGAAVGFISLESYWILKGWRSNRRSIVVMGLTGIAITLGVIDFYLSLIK